MAAGSEESGESELWGPEDLFKVVAGTERVR